MYRRPTTILPAKRALLVEDNEVNIEITRNILLHKNLQVDVAVNGEEGVTHFLSMSPDITTSS